MKIQQSKNKPYKSYNGGKARNGTYQNIICNIPKCEMFVDVMMGNGGIFVNLDLPKLTIINDINKVVADKYLGEG